MKIDDLKGKTIEEIAKAISEDENILSIALTDNEGGMLGETYREHGAEATATTIAGILVVRKEENFLKSIYDGFNLFTAASRKAKGEFNPAQCDCLKHATFEIQNWLAWDTDFRFRYQKTIMRDEKKRGSPYIGWPIKGVSKLSARMLLNLGNVILWIAIRDGEFAQMNNAQRIVYTMAGVNFARVQKTIFGLKPEKRRGKQT